MNYWRERSKPYKVGQKTPYKISRSKIELYMQCPRCFWLDVRHKITRPNTPPFNINKAIDELLKKEFDHYRNKKEAHPIMIENKLDAKPYEHNDLDEWRNNFVGIWHVHKPTNLHIFGAVDDIWINHNDELLVVDYKATAKDKEVTIDSNWQLSYKRQLEIYQWLLRQNDFNVSSQGYFVYTNARLDMDGFFDKIEFKTKLIGYEGDDSWVSPTIEDIKKCIDGDIPAVGEAAMGGACDYCSYAKSRTGLTIEALGLKSKK